MKLKKRVLLIIFHLFFCAPLIAQSSAFNIKEVDTLKMGALRIHRVAALEVGDAIVLVDYGYVLKRLKIERKGLKKQINSRDRMLRKNPTNKTIRYQRAFYNEQFVIIDSSYQLIRKIDKRDTAWIPMESFSGPFGDFIPAIIESGQCVILNDRKEIQHFIIKKSGWEKTGAMTAVGKSYYYLPGSEDYFWSKMDWIS
jgi:hypothetical protein